MRPYLLAFGAAGVASLLVTPIVRRLAVRLGAVDVPDGRKVHAQATPSLGGLAIYVGLVAGLVVAATEQGVRDLYQSSSEAFGVVAAATAIVLLGVVDDIRGLRASTKLAGQVLASGVLVLFGVVLLYFWVPGVGLLSLSPDISALLTVVWTVALVNALNLIDGLDGLAAGVSTIAAVGFFAYAYASADGGISTAALLTAAIAGACLGFLRHNFNPARIFMGDAGSMQLGLVLAAATVSGVGRTTEPQFSDLAGIAVPALIPLLVLAIPLADAGLAVLRRVAGGRPVFHPDKEHIHHRLLDMAASHRRAVLVMYLWSSMAAGAGVALALGGGTAGRATAAGLGSALVATIVFVPRALRSRAAPIRDSIHKRAGPVGPT